jgi:hypothetical protein
MVQKLELEQNQELRQRAHRRHLQSAASPRRRQKKLDALPEDLFVEVTKATFEVISPSFDRRTG